MPNLTNTQLTSLAAIAALLGETGIQTAASVALRSRDAKMVARMQATCIAWLATHNT